MQEEVKARARITKAAALAAVGTVASRLGVRNVLVVAFLAGGVVSQVMVWTLGWPSVGEWLFAAFLVVAAIFMVAWPSMGDYGVALAMIAQCFLPQYTPIMLLLFAGVVQCLDGTFRRNYLPVVVNMIASWIGLSTSVGPIIAYEILIFDLIALAAGWASRVIVDEKARAVDEARQMEVATQRRIAGEIHDSTARGLSQVVLVSRLIRNECLDEGRAPTVEELEAIEVEANQVLLGTRSLIKTLETELAANTTAGAASSRATLETALATWGRVRNLRMELVWDLNGEVTPSVARLLDRLLAEVLANCEKYASNQTPVCLRVWDDPAGVWVEQRNQVDNREVPSGVSGKSGLERLGKKIVKHGGSLQTRLEGETWQLKALIENE